MKNKISLNELRSLVKQIIKEENNKLDVVYLTFDDIELKVTGYFEDGESDEYYDSFGEPGTPGTSDMFEIESIEIMKGNLLDIFNYFVGYKDINNEIELRCIDELKNNF